MSIYPLTWEMSQFIVPIHGKLPPDVAADRAAILITQAETFISKNILTIRFQPKGGENMTTLPA